MPDPVTSDTNVITKQETTDVIGLDGKSHNPATSPLAGMFDKIEAGKADGRTAQEVVKQEPTAKPRDDSGKFAKPEVKAPEAKPAEVKVEKKEEPAPKKEEAPADPREALRRTFEDQAKKKEEKAPADTKPAEAPTEEEVTEAEMQVLPHDKPKTAKRISALLAKIGKIEGEAALTKKAVEEKAAKLAELEAKLATEKTVDPATDEKIKKQLDELSMYRRRYELDTDPEVKTKFDSRVESAETSITETLKKRGAAEGLLNLIKEEGGWNNFAGSSRIVTIPDGEGGQKQVTAAQLAEMVLTNLPLAERKGVEAAMMEQVQTKRDRERYFKEQQDTAVQYFKKKEEEVKSHSMAQQKQLEEAKKTIDNWQKAVLAQDWIKDKEVPANATVEQKAAILEGNKYNGQLRDYLGNAIVANDLPKVLSVVEDAVRYYDERRTSSNLKRENDRLKAELDAKVAELTKFKTAGRSVAKSGSIAVAPTHQSAAERKPKSLEEAFAALERGEGVTGKESDE